MTNTEIMTLSKGKYASQRREFLENHAPKLLADFEKSGYLEEHLANIQETVAEYVEQTTEHYKHTDEYLNALPTEAFGLLNMTVLTAESDAYRMWIAVSSEDEEETDEDDDDYNYIFRQYDYDEDEEDEDYE